MTEQKPSKNYSIYIIVILGLFIAGTGTICSALLAIKGALLQDLVFSFFAISFGFIIVILGGVMGVSEDLAYVKNKIEAMQSK